MWNNLAFNLKHIQDDLFGDDVAGMSLGHEAAPREHDQVIGVMRGEIEVVQHHDDGLALFIQSFQ